MAAAQARAEGARVSVATNATFGDVELTAHVPGFDRVTVIDMPKPHGVLGGVFDGSLTRAFRQLAADHDVLHLHNVWDPMLPAAARGARQAGTPYLITPHGMLDTWSLAQRAAKKRIAMETTHRSLLRKAAAFHCLNEHEAATVAALRLGPATRVVANGVWLSRVDAAAGVSFREQHPALGGDPFVLFLSRLHRKKGIDFLLPAFEKVAARYPTLRLVVAGPDGGDQSLVEQAMAQSPHGSRIHLVGPLYGAAKFAALRETTCFVLPSRQEGFPMAVLEALGSGAPVVISPECHVDEVASAGAGVIAALSVDAIARGIDQIVSTPDARSVYGVAGRWLVESKYTWEHVALESTAMYRSVLGRV